MKSVSPSVRRARLVRRRIRLDVDTAAKQLSELVLRGVLAGG